MFTEEVFKFLQDLLITKFNKCFNVEHLIIFITIYSIYECSRRTGLALLMFHFHVLYVLKYIFIRNF